MDLFSGNAVNPGFCIGQSIECTAGSRHHRLRQIASFDDSNNLSVVAVLTTPMVVVSMIVLVPMVVLVAMGVIVPMFVCRNRRPFFAPTDGNLNVNAPEAHTNDLSLFDRPAIDREGSQGGFEFGYFQAQVEQGPEGHVTGNATETVEIEQA
jgi:hypothetical protein